MFLPVIAERVRTELVEQPEYDAGGHVRVEDVQPDLILEHSQESVFMELKIRFNLF